MIELKNISKVYRTGNVEQKALDDISIAFRDAEFVSILGASGSGKTTLLNIVGGLDRASSGVLFIDDVSTLRYKSSDWDTYRNHHVGFIFQSYNLIPHQTVLANVEIALTLSGISASERKERALAVLDKVGLSEHVGKKPNQLSGGQAQRVAIARALVNDPDIILADEPTGALDTNTGIQVMDILKEVSQERLVIMVTHNPELAEEYATRIVTIKDGKLLADTNPLALTAHKTQAATQVGSTVAGPTITVGGKTLRAGMMQSDSESSVPDDISSSSKEVAEDQMQATAKLDSSQKSGADTSKKHLVGNRPHKKRASMSYATALSLSFNNLMTKKGRTFLTSFAGSIGITGIAIILALSNGVADYVQKMQRDALSSMPLVITRDSFDIFKAQEELETKATEEATKDNEDSNVIEQKENITEIFSPSEEESKSPNENPVKKNNLKKFKAYLQEHKSEIDPLVLNITYNYDVTPLMIRDNDGEYEVVGNTIQGQDPFKKLEAANILNPSKKSFSNNGFDRILDNTEVLKTSFTLEKGTWPSSEHDAVLILNDDGTIDSYTLYGLGVLNNKEIDKYVEDLQNKNKAKEDKKPLPNVTFTYDDALALEYKAIPAALTYVKDGKGYKQDLSEDNLKKISEDAYTIKVVGVLKPKSNPAMQLAAGVYYHETVPSIMIEKAKETQIVKDQLDNSKVDVFSGKTFEQIEKEKENPFETDSEMDISSFMPEIPEMPKIDPMDGLADMLTPESLSISPGQVAQSIKAILSSVDTQQLTDIVLKAPTPDIDKLDLKDIPEEKKQEIAKEALSLAQKFASWYLAQQAQIQEDVPFEVIVFNYLAEPESVASLNKIESLIDTTTKDKAKGWVSQYLNKSLIPYFKTSLDPVIEQLTDATAEQINVVMGQKIGEMTEAFSTMLASQLGSMAGMGLGPMAFPMPQIPDMSAMKLPSSLEGLKNLFDNEDVSYDANLSSLGYADIDEPQSISLYPKSFEDKGSIEQFITDYNDKVTADNHPEDVISYNDFMKFLVEQVVKIIDTISMILIAFVSISLVVSSIMIGIITYISVLERRKEIGILRAMGASRTNIANVFNAETTIEGFISGMIALVLVYLVSIPVNITVNNLFEIEGIMNLPIGYALILLAVAIGLNLIAGLIPSSKAARKDPVEALRSE